MAKIIFLTVDGNLGDGLEMSLLLCETNGTLPIVPVSEKGRLKANPELKEYYEFWLNTFVTLRSYRLRGESFEDWEVDEGTVTQRSTLTGEDACREFVRLTENNFKNWLSESGDRHWMSIRETLVQELARHPEDVSIIIQTKETETDLWKLPWYAWDLLERYPNVGIAFSFPSGQRVSNIAPIQPESFTGNKVRILVVLGSDDGIDLDPDKQAILDLAEADPHFLTKPTAQKLNQTLRDPQGWDIFLFAGHSESDQHKERIYISEHEFVGIADFKNSLREAMSHGLKVAIFNSCQGMGLAERLADLHLPFSIVMQEPVPDRIAQAFLKEFLTEYSQGKLLYTAVRIATERLEDFSQKWPGATWLPIICQNPTELPPSWQDLLQDSSSDKIPDLIPEDNSPDLPEIPEFPPRKPSPFAKNWRRQLQTVVVTSLLMTGLVIGVRSQGWLQPLELQAYDHVMRMRPAESPDNRILLITINEEDVQSQPGKKIADVSISDRNLAQLLEKLEQYEPRVIGLFLYRDFLDPENSPYLANLMQSDRFITICSYDTTKKIGIKAPPGVSLKNLGFANVVPDPGNVLRRQVFGVFPPKPECNTSFSFSAQVARLYLDKEGIEFGINRNGKLIWRENNIQISAEYITKNSGGYNSGYTTFTQIDERGIQFLINYRSLKPESHIAQKVSLTDFLENPGGINIKDRIVLIGRIDKDMWRTPYSTVHLGSGPEMSALEIQAHLISQIISTSLNQRPLIWWWPESIEFLWIGGWSLLGSFLILLFRKPQHLLLSFGSFLMILYVMGRGVMANSAGWIPLIPPALAFISTGIAVFYVLSIIKK